MNFVKFARRISVVMAALMLFGTLSGCVVTDEPPADTTPPPVTTPEETTLPNTTPPDTVPPETTTSEDTTMPDNIPTVKNPYTVLNYDDIKAIWISQFDMMDIYCSDGVQRSRTVYTNYVTRVLNNVVSQGLNTVILQMRPNADSMYPSDYYPMSRYVVGKYGAEAAYDPVEIFIELAHERNLSVQAWINPMRAMKTAEIKSVNDRYPIKKWYLDSSKKINYLYAHTNGYYYLNPAYEEVRSLIIEGARELVTKYDVDGLHMDDYFYPTTAPAYDSRAYSEYKKNGGDMSLGDWRREQVNILVRGLYSMVKEVDPDILFGISPAGNFDKTYGEMYADIYEWCATPGYIDYICPQAYFGFEHSTYDYVKVVNAHRDMIKTDKVKLIVGMTLGKAVDGYNGKGDQYAGAGKNEWIEHRDILVRQLEYTENLEHCTGVAYFAYQYFFHPTGGAPVAESATERSKFIPLLNEISWK